MDAAKRELLEETGYSSDDWTCLCKSAPNASAMTNFCYCYVAKKAKKTDIQHLDTTEDLSVLEVSEEELLELIRSEAIVEADMLYGLWRYFMVNKINI